MLACEAFHKRTKKTNTGFAEFTYSKLEKNPIPRQLNFGNTIEGRMGDRAGSSPASDTILLIF